MLPLPLPLSLLPEGIPRWHVTEHVSVARPVSLPTDLTLDCEHRVRWQSKDNNATHLEHTVSHALTPRHVAINWANISLALA